MSVSRRSFFSAVAGAIAGAVASRVVAKAPAVKEIAVPPMAGKTPSICEFARQYMGVDIPPWQEDVLTTIEARKLTATVRVPACLLEDSQVDVRGQIAEMIGREMAEKWDRECWEWTKPYPKYTLKSIREAMDSCPKPCHQELVCSAAQMRDLVAMSEPKETVIDELWGHDQAFVWGEQRIMGFPVKVVDNLPNGVKAMLIPPRELGPAADFRTIYGANGQQIGFSFSTNWPVKNSA